MDKSHRNISVVKFSARNIARVDLSNRIECFHQQRYLVPDTDRRTDDLDLGLSMRILHQCVHYISWKRSESRVWREVSDGSGAVISPIMPRSLSSKPATSLKKLHSFISHLRRMKPMWSLVYFSINYIRANRRYGVYDQQFCQSIEAISRVIKFHPTSVEVGDQELSCCLLYVHKINEESLGD